MFSLLLNLSISFQGLLWWLSGKESTCQCKRQEMQVRSLGQKDPLEKEMVTHSSILAWKIPQTEDPGGLQSMGSRRVGHDWVTNTFIPSVAQSAVDTEKGALDCTATLGKLPCGNYIWWAGSWRKISFIWQMKRKCFKRVEYTKTFDRFLLAV